MGPQASDRSVVLSVPRNSFTNWTRSSSSIIGSVFLYTDYTLPVPAIQAKAEEVREGFGALGWQSRKHSECLTAKEQTMEIRILVSASNSSKAWDLRCEVREKLISFIGTAIQDRCRARAGMASTTPGGGPEISTSH